MLYKVVLFCKVFSFIQGFFSISSQLILVKKTVGGNCIFLSSEIWTSAGCFIFLNKERLKCAGAELMGFISCVTLFCRKEWRWEWPESSTHLVPGCTWMMDVLSVISSYRPYKENLSLYALWTFVWDTHQRFCLFQTSDFVLALEFDCRAYKHHCCSLLFLNTQPFKQVIFWRIIHFLRHGNNNPFVVFVYRCTVRVPKLEPSSM